MNEGSKKEKDVSCAKAHLGLNFIRRKRLSNCKAADTIQRNQQGGQSTPQHNKTLHHHMMSGLNQQKNGMGVISAHGSFVRSLLSTGDTRFASVLNRLTISTLFKWRTTTSLALAQALPQKTTPRKQNSIHSGSWIFIPPFWKQNYKY